MVVSSIFVRKAVKADLKYAEEATKVVNAAYRSEGGWTTEKDIVAGERCTIMDMEQYILENGKPNTLLLAFDQAETNTNTSLENATKIVGTVQIQPSELPGEAEIGLFSVSPSFQSRGIGSRLVQTAMAEMKELGFHTAMMHVIENRTEILTWYKKIGFVETGERIPFVWPELLKQDKNLHFITLKKKLD